MMKSTVAFLALVAAAASLQVASAGTLSGKVTLNGNPPAEKEIEAVKNDPNCGPLHKEPVKTQFYVVGADKGLKDVVVYITNIHKSTGDTAAPLVLDQKGCEYVPYIAAVQTGQKVVIKNSDPVFHNVDMIPAAEGNASKQKNAAQGPGAPDITTSFPAPENFLRIKCDVHQWMFSYVTVVDNPYFAVTAKDGTFTIPNLPAGKYTVEAIHRKAGKQTKDIEVKDGDTKLDFTFDFVAK